MGILFGTDGRIVHGTDGLPVYVSSTTTARRTYGTLQARIQDEMIDAAITTVHIQNAILDAIKDYEATNFWFNSIREDQNYSFTVGQEFYSPDDIPFLATSPHISILSVLAFNNRWPLNPRTPQWIEEQSVQPTWRALPTDWCMTGDTLRIYPIPDQSYPLIFTGTMRWPTLSASQDANPWTDDAERLVRYRAKAILFRHILRDDASAAIMDAEEARELRLLKRETTTRVGGPGRLRVRGWF